MNLLLFLPVTSQVCDLVSALTEDSFLVFQKAVPPGGLEGLLGTEHAGRWVAGAAHQAGGDVSVIWGLGPLETKRHRKHKRWLWRWWDSGKLGRPLQLAVSSSLGGKSTLCS